MPVDHALMREPLLGGESSILLESPQDQSILRGKCDAKKQGSLQAIIPVVLEY